MFILMLIQNFLPYSKLHMPTGLPDGMTWYGTGNHKHPCACQVWQHYAERMVIDIGCQVNTCIVNRAHVSLCPI